jgi:hypothetical protein
MVLDRIMDLPRRGLLRWKPTVITLADRACDVGQWELATQLYRQALDRNPRDPSIWGQYGHALKESGELRDPDTLAQAEIATEGRCGSIRRGRHVSTDRSRPETQGKTEEAQQLTYALSLWIRKRLIHCTNWPGLAAQNPG